MQRRTPSDRGTDKPTTFKISSNGARRRRSGPQIGDDVKRDSKPLRLKILSIICIALGITVGVRLWYLQILDQEAFAAEAERNQVRISRSQAPRGRILANDGTPIVDNRVSISVGIEARRLRELDRDDRDVVIKRVSDLVGVPVTEIEDALEFPKVNPNDPIPVTGEVPIEVIAEIKERPENYPGVVPIMRPIREFRLQLPCDEELDPNDPAAQNAAPRANCPTAAAHILGYVGETLTEEVDGSTGSGREYRLGDLIGRAGVEKQYEDYLRGIGGKKSLEVDAQGRQISVLDEQDPVQGKDIVLTIDPRIQLVAEEALEAGIMKARSTGGGYNAPAGTVVVLDPRDGSVRAMASYPTFDPAEFEGGIGEDLWAALNDEANYQPLNNRAIQAEYPAASTWKPVMGFAALQNGFIDPNTVVAAGPSFKPGASSRAFKDWKPGGHGATNYRKSLVWSVDVYYYKLGFAMQQAGGDIAQQAARESGFGSQTGIDLPFEQDGRVPDENWKRAMYNANPEAFPDGTWYPGDAINMSIGQGDVLVTPLQMANFYASIANGGTIYQPRLLDRVIDADGNPVVQAPPKAVGRLPANEDIIARTQDALAGVIAEGTGAGTFRGFPLDEFRVAGKTGTGQMFGRQDITWLAAYGPFEDPQYVVLAVVEEGGGQSGPIVRKIFEAIAGIGDGTEVGEGAVAN